MEMGIPLLVPQSLTQCFHCHGPGLDPWSKKLSPHKTGGAEKKNSCGISRDCQQPKQL